MLVALMLTACGPTAGEREKQIDVWIKPLVYVQDITTVICAKGTPERCAESRRSLEEQRATACKWVSKVDDRPCDTIIAEFKAARR